MSFGAAAYRPWMNTPPVPCGVQLPVPPVKSTVSFVGTAPVPHTFVGEIARASAADAPPVRAVDAPLRAQVRDRVAHHLRPRVRAAAYDRPVVADGEHVARVHGVDAVQERARDGGRLDAPRALRARQ